MQGLVPKEAKMPSNLLVGVCSAVVAAVLAGAASATVTVTGSPLTSTGSTWIFAGNSLQSTNVVWAGGSTTRSIDYYATNFVYGAGDSANADMGNANGSIGGTGWNVGDRVIGIGWKVNNGATAGWLNGQVFMKFNPSGTGTYSAADSVGGTGAITSFGASVEGDYQLFGSINNGNQSRIVSYRNRTASSSDYPLQVGGSPNGALLENPFRSYSVLASGTPAPGSAAIESQTFLINLDYLARAGVTYGFTPNSIGDLIGKLHIQVGSDITPGVAGIATDVVLTNVVVPAPGAIALLGVAGLMGRRRRN